MEAVILDQITFCPNIQTLVEKVRLRPGSPLIADFERMVDEAQSVARPKALYRIAYIDDKNPDDVVLDGITFKSRVLRVNLETAQRVFAFTATCGVELDEWSHGFHDLLQQYWADVIKETALNDAYNFLLEHLAQQYKPGSLSDLSPGSLEDFPIQEQKTLFSLLGDTQKMVGVKLTESMLMVPIKSISGILFPVEESFQSCELCPRPTCPGRRAKYDPTLFARKYQPKPT